MISFFALWAYVGAFFSTVVVQCARPTNWDRCVRVNDWLVPWIRDVAVMYENGAYSSEKKLLEQAK